VSEKPGKAKDSRDQRTEKAFRTSASGPSRRPPGGLRLGLGTLFVALTAMLAAVAGAYLFLGDEPVSVDRPAANPFVPSPQPHTGPQRAPLPGPKPPSKPGPVVTPLQAPVTHAATGGAGETASAPAPAPAGVGLSFAELSRKSADHAAIARILEEYDKIRTFDPNIGPDQMFEDYQKREAKERELLEQIRRLGPASIGALKEMLLGADDNAYRLLMAKALGGWDHPDALQASLAVLQEIKDVAVQTTIARYLPETPPAASLMAQAFASEGDANLRSMLLREYARRVGDGEGEQPGPRTQEQLDQGRELLRKAAVEDPDASVRAEAIAIVGRRGDPRDAELVSRIAKEEPNVYIRQRAIVALGETAGPSSLGQLEDLARSDGSLEIRASAVLAIGRVGGDRAVQILDQIARTDSSEEIRTRAERLAAALRARAQAEAEERNRPRVPIDPNRPVPLEPPAPGGPWDDPAELPD
jgi:hypothetical protein